MFDGDEAGQNAQMSLGEQLLKSGANVYVISIPKGMDPDEFIESRGTAVFESLVKNERKHYIHFKADQLLEERSEEHTSELQSRGHLVCRLLLEKKKNQARQHNR